MNKSKEPNLYKLLQVNSSAHPTVIRYAYRFLAGMYHPENEKTGNVELFRKVTEAFRVLSDEGKRAQYDNELGLNPDDRFRDPPNDDPPEPTEPVGSPVSR